MSTSYMNILQDRTKTMGKMHKSMPEFMQAFAGLSKVVNSDGALNHKTKELIELALAVANHCQGCIAFHVSSCIKQGASRDEMMEVLQLAVFMGGGPSMMYACEAVDAIDELMS